MIISVSRWNVTLTEAQEIARTVAPILRDAGATEIRLGTIQAGPHAGRIVTTVGYPNGETYGKAQDQLQQNQTYNQALGKILDRLIDRSLVNTENVQ